MRTQGFNFETGEITDRELTQNEIQDLQTVPVYEIPQMEWAEIKDGKIE